MLNCPSTLKLAHALVILLDDQRSALNSNSFRGVLDFGGILMGDESEIDAAQALCRLIDPEHTGAATAEHMNHFLQQAQLVLLECARVALEVFCQLALPPLIHNVASAAAESLDADSSGEVDMNELGTFLKRLPEEDLRSPSGKSAVLRCSSWMEQLSRLLDGQHLPREARQQLLTALYRLDYFRQLLHSTFPLLHDQTLKRHAGFQDFISQLLPDQNQILLWMFPTAVEPPPCLTAALRACPDLRASVMSVADEALSRPGHGCAVADAYFKLLERNNAGWVHCSHFERLVMVLDPGIGAEHKTEALFALLDGDRDGSVARIELLESLSSMVHVCVEFARLNIGSLETVLRAGATHTATQVATRDLCEGKTLRESAANLVATVNELIKSLMWEDPRTQQF
eukprot:TRINITY_DN6327_c0_g1_i12.p1 TRINITY_DN6327_c0_g1~~TRINITY_DN6327_c0_g1_i12.p1  ORF type:complete len:400 (+),score=70.66 TRINITY_DN6327_c0_g1_i12:1148-2347(+)